MPRLNAENRLMHFTDNQLLYECIVNDFGKDLMYIADSRIRDIPVTPITRASEAFRNNLIAIHSLGKKIKESRDAIIGYVALSAIALVGALFATTTPVFIGTAVVSALSISSALFLLQCLKMNEIPYIIQLVNHPRAFAREHARRPA